ncbi:3-oxoacyl-[acyl-carrier-protein] reductase [Candidatus Dependentiae bacterium]|nr:3-oxoacyl-[acyl-carrier-protein] reductase [Candidatus Dependentiae bacterium]
MLSLKGKVAFITGSAQGIGKAIAKKLGEQGADLVLIDINEEVLNKTVEDFKSLNVKVKSYICDISDFNKTDAMAKTVLEDFGKVDIIVNNAGITRDNLVMRMSESEWDLVIRINLTGTFNVCKAFTRFLLKQRSGRIINISSVIGLMGNAGQVNYAASKAGLLGLTKSLAKEFGARNILVNAIAPGFIETEMTKQLSDSDREAYLKIIPLKRFGSPEDVSNIVLFLSSELSSYVTGQVIQCDGGMIM